jgi:hypothetical protein
MLIANNRKHNIGLKLSFDCGYISKEVAGQLLSQCSSIGKMINSMITKSSLFCKPKSKSKPN